MPQHMTPCSPALQSPSLSGLSPFLGDNDTETLNNVLAANWYFDEETFESVSDEAKDFVSNLIIKEKRCGAGGSHGSPPTCVLSSLPMCHSPCWGHQHAQSHQLSPVSLSGPPKRDVLDCLWSPFPSGP